MSTENPIISNFDGLGELEELLSTCRLTLELPRQEGMTLPDDNDGRALYLERSEFTQLGMKVTADWTDEQVQSACELARIGAKDIHLVTIVEDAAMKLRSVIDSTCLASWDGQLFVSGPATRTVASLLNDRSGFDVEIVLALMADLEYLSARPHRKGTILAKESFNIRVEADFGGINPLPLTSEILTELKLPPKTTSFIDLQDSLLEAEQVGDSIRLYLNEKLLESLKVVRGRSSLALQSITALDFQKQIVYLISRELRELEESERLQAADAAALRMVAAWVKEVGRYEKDNFIDQVCNAPHQVCAWISSRNDLATKTVSLLGDEQEDQGEF